jgi:hypothetical protein
MARTGHIGLSHFKGILVMDIEVVKMAEEDKPIKLTPGELEQWNEAGKFIDAICREIAGAELRKNMLMGKLQSKMDGQQDLVTKIQQKYGMGQQQQFQVDSVTGVVTMNGPVVMVKGRVPDGE